MSEFGREVCRASISRFARRTNQHNPSDGFLVRAIELDAHQPIGVPAHRARPFAQAELDVDVETGRDSQHVRNFQERATGRLIAHDAIEHGLALIEI